MLITEKDVGRKVLHRDGAVSAITGWDDEDPRWTSHIETYFYKDGRFIIAFADEKERTMKHVIANEAQEDVIEWDIVRVGPGLRLTMNGRDVVYIEGVTIGVLTSALKDRGLNVKVDNKLVE